MFANLLLADEINRAPAKTQAALLEAMQERQVTTEGATRRLERPSSCSPPRTPSNMRAPIPLPEAQLDRFLLRISVGYPGRDDEALVLARRGERRQERIDLEPVVDRGDPARDAAGRRARVRVGSVRLYMVDIVRETRDNRRVQVGSSPRGSLALYTLARARAVLRGRDFVTPEDVKDVAVPALAHRLTLRPEVWVQRVPTQDIIREILETVPTPPVRDAESGGVTQCEAPRPQAPARGRAQATRATRSPSRPTRRAQAPHVARRSDAETLPQARPVRRPGRGLLSAGSGAWPAGAGRPWRALRTDPGGGPVSSAARRGGGLVCALERERVFEGDEIEAELVIAPSRRGGSAGRPRPQAASLAGPACFRKGSAWPTARRRCCCPKAGGGRRDRAPLWRAARGPRVAGAARVASRRQTSGSAASRSALSPIAGEATGWATPCGAAPTPPASSSRTARVRGDSPLYVYPRTERLRSLIAPSKPSRSPVTGWPEPGERASNSPKPGPTSPEIVRAGSTGGRPRSARRLYVNEQHPERNSDVMIFLDTLCRGEARGRKYPRPGGAGCDHACASTISPPATASVSSALEPWCAGSPRGRVTSSVIASSKRLLETEVAFSFAWRDIDTLPVRSLTPHALVIALTPLLDERGTRALLDLRRRGFDLVVVEISPLAFATGGTDPVDVLATRFWRLWRDSVRFRFEEMGVAVVEWDGQVPLAAAIEEVRAFRRFARFASR